MSSRRLPASDPAEPAMARRLGAECFGTFALTLIACGSEAASAGHPEISAASRAVAPALMVMALIYAISDVSGAHVNPAVSFAFALRGVFAWAHLPLYWAAQLAGALIGAATIRGLFGPAGGVGATWPRLPVTEALLVEALLTMLLVSIILHTSRRRAAVGTQAALAVGGTIALCGLWAGPLTGASMNPARSLGPALLGHHLDVCWLYVVGPLLGSAIAAGLVQLIHGPPAAQEQDAAEGEQGAG
jgi:MIP family channel proteins